VVFTNIQDGIVYRMLEEPLRSLGHRIVAVVTSPGPPKRRDSAYLSVVEALPSNVEMLVSNRPSSWAPIVRAWNPDLIIVGGFPWKIPAEVIEIPPLGTINMHPALLPRHRGPHSFENAFRVGDAETGFTIHRMSTDFDTGNILAQVRVPIEDDDDLAALLAKFGPLTPTLIQEALERVARGDAGEPQDESLATYAPKPEPEWRIIDWDRPARTIHNQVRTWTGARYMEKGAFGLVGGQRVLVLRTRLVPTSDRFPLAAPGTVLERDGDRIVVHCCDAPLALIEWRPVTSFD
jgi:methionyl-tRNA formyltransferase